MPYGDLNPGARRRHNVRVVTVGRYRMLKDTNTHKVNIYVTLALLYFAIVPGDTTTSSFGAITISDCMVFLHLSLFSFLVLVSVF